MQNLLFIAYEKNATRIFKCLLEVKLDELWNSRDYARIPQLLKLNKLTVCAGLQLIYVL